MIFELNDQQKTIIVNMQTNLGSVDIVEETWCRTCKEKASINFLHPLEEIPENCPSLADMLLEISKINTKTENEQGLPKHICGNCTYKLKNAYSFVVQAQQVNKQFLATLDEVADMCISNDIGKHVDCLQEAPIDMECVQVKMEIDADEAVFEAFGVLGGGFDREACNDKNNMESTMLSDNLEKDMVAAYSMKEEIPFGTQEESGMLSDNLEKHMVVAYSMKEEIPFGTQEETNDFQASYVAVDPITLAETHWDNENSPGEGNIQYDADCSDRPLSEKLPKRRRGRPATKITNTNESKEGRFICDACGKTFAWKKDLQRHEKSHFAVPEFECEYCERKFFRKDKLNDHIKTHQKSNHRYKLRRRPEWNFAERLYSDKPFQLIQCKLCKDIFKSTHELRQHLAVHTSPDTLQHIKLTSEIVKEFFTQTQELDEIKAIICKDITLQQFAKYFAVVNEFGYEMCLSDSDTDVTVNENDLLTKYKCELCRKTFARKYQVFAHIKEQHGMDQLPYRCAVCKVEFVCEQMYNLHTNTQCRCKEKKYQCIKCPGKFMWSENLKGHKCSNRLKSSDTKTNKDLTCTICEKTFNNSKDLKNHLAKHDISSDTNECTIEDKTNSQVGNKFQCDQCQKVFICPYVLTRHKHVHMPDEEKYECPYCGRKFNRKDNMRTHLKVHGSQAVASILAKKDTQRHKPTKVKVKDRLTAHVKKVHKEGATKKKKTDLSLIDPVTGEKVKKPIMEKKYSCVFCGKAVSSSSNLNTHMRRHRGEKRYKCDFCDKAFLHLSDLRCHRRTHTGEKPHICTVCNKAFSRPYPLHVHMRIHSGERPYKCTYCEKRFVQSNALKLHNRLHTGERPYVCGICGECFLQGTALKTHRQKRGHHENIEPKRKTLLEQF